MQNDPLLIPEEKGFLLVGVVVVGNVDRAAGVIAENVLMVGRGGGREVVDCVQIGVAPELPRGAVPVGRAALGLRDNDRRAQQRILRGEVVLEHAHFFKGIGVRNYRICRHVAGVLVPHAVQHVKAARHVEAVDGENAAGRAAAGAQRRALRRGSHAGHHHRQSLVVASIHGQRANLFAANIGRNLRSGGLHFGGGCVHRDVLRFSAYRERRVHRNRFCWVQFDA